MQLQHTSEFSPGGPGTRFRESALAMPVYFVLCVIAALAAHDAGHDWLAWACAFLALFGARVALRGFGRAHFVLVHRPDGIALRARSHLNDPRGEQRPVVAWIPNDEIQSVRRLTLTRSAPGTEADSVQTVRETFLEVRLTHAHTAELRALLEAERQPLPGRGQWHHYPLALAAPDVLRVTWKGPNCWVRPSITRALRVLGTTLPVLSPIDVMQGSWRALEGAAFDDYLLDLVLRGETIEAVKVLRERRGLGLTEARTLIAELNAPARAA